MLNYFFSKILIHQNNELRKKFDSKLVKEQYYLQKVKMQFIEIAKE